MATQTPDTQSTERSQDGKEVSEISDLVLYDLSRAHATLSSISRKPKWSNADTAGFDCMHYNGDAALEHCASKLNIQPNEHVLDIGSGFSSTGRFLASKYGVLVTGIELQRENHELAQVITARNEDPRVVEAVRSINADFLTLDPAVISRDGGSAQVDHIVSFLCILHIPKSSWPLLFQQAARFLREGGKLYVEDFYNIKRTADATASLTDSEKVKLREFMACTYLHTAKDYIAHVEAAGFDSVEFEDVSEPWKRLLHMRADRYRDSKDPNPSLQLFYDTVADLFEGGNVGGVRLVAMKRS